MEFMVHITDSESKIPRPGETFYDLSCLDKVYMRITSPMSYIILDTFERDVQKYFVVIDLTNGEIVFKEYENSYLFFNVDCKNPIVFHTREG